MAGSGSKQGAKFIGLVAVILVAMVFIIRGCGSGGAAGDKLTKPVTDEVPGEFYSPVTGKRVTIFYVRREGGAMKYRLPEDTDYLPGGLPEKIKDPSSGRMIPLAEYRTEWVGQDEGS